jgi:hypothetical protein
VTLSEALATQATLGASLAESVTLAEALGAGLTTSVDLEEAVVLTEALGAGLTTSVDLVESVTLAEALGALRAVDVALSEGLSLSEALGALRSFSANLVETVVLSEELLARIQLPPALRTALALSTTRTAATLSTTKTAAAISTTRTAATMTSTLRSSSDSADTFRATLTRDGAPYSLVGAQSVSLRWRRRGGTGGSLVLTVVNATGGIVERAWQASDLEPGAYEVQVRVVDTNGNQLSFPNGGYQSLTVLATL